MPVLTGAEVETLLRATHVDPEMNRWQDPGATPGGSNLSSFALARAWYKTRMAREIDCEVCGKHVTATNNRQRSCLGRDCKLRLRSEIRKRERRVDRKQNPIECVWCLEPITEIGKRKYHTECKAEKNRLRVKIYNATHAPTSQPTTKRAYAGKVRCRYCRKRVPRTGARQIACGARSCENARKAERKRVVRAELRAEKERLKQARERKRAQHQHTTPEFVEGRELYRVVL